MSHYPSNEHDQTSNYELFSRSSIEPQSNSRPTCPSTPSPSRHPSNEHDQTSNYELLPRSEITAHSNYRPASPSPPNSSRSSYIQVPPSPNANAPPLEASETEPSRSLIPDTWIFEGIAIIFSVLCFIAMIVVLKVYDQKPQPTLAYGVTLNALISTLATGSKSSLVFVIGECIGQLKWVWFYRGKRKQLVDMQLFDSASRGPLGSLTMAFKHRGRSLVSLGAFVLVLALAIDPFMQQVLVYPVRPTVTATNSQLAAAKQSVNFIPEYRTQSLQDVIFTGVWSQDFEVTPSCPSGNCTWPDFQSVGMCSQCEDVTAKAVLKCDPPPVNISVLQRFTTPCYVELEQGVSGKFDVTGELYEGRVHDAKTNISDGYPDLRAMMERPVELIWAPYTLSRYIDNFTYAGVLNPQSVIAHAKIALASNDTKGFSPLTNMGKTLMVTSVTQCVMALCLRTYQLAVTNGNSFINVSSPEYGEIFNNTESESTLDSLCWKAGNGGPVPVSRLSASSWANESAFAFCPASTYHLEHALSGDYTTTLNIDNSSTLWSRNQFLGNAEYNMAKIVSTGLGAVMSNVAASFTKDGLTSSNNTVGGTISTMEVYVQVKWLWMILPGVLTVLGVIFFISTIVVNRGQKLDLWKSSIVAVLFHGLDDWGDKAANVPSMVGQMEKTAQEIQVKLRALDDQKMLFLDRS